MGKLKSATVKAGSVITDIVGVIVAVLPSILKKKKYCLWYQGTAGKWNLKAGPMSHRQCVKTMRALIELGAYLSDKFIILRQGVTP